MKGFKSNTASHVQNKSENYGLDAFVVSKIHLQRFLGHPNGIGKSTNFSMKVRTSCMVKYKSSMENKKNEPKTFPCKHRQGLQEDQKTRGQSG